MNIKQIIDPTKYVQGMTPIEMVLANRGVEDIGSFFELDWDCVQTPYDIVNLEAVADKILHHLRTSKSIAILVDADADGFTSSAVLGNYIEMQRLHGDNGPDETWDGNTPEITYLFHENKEHGLSDTVVMKKLRDLVKPALLIVPDASGSATQYKALNDIGIEVVVIDHHKVNDGKYGDMTIVANNQLSPQYKNKDLSGVGVVYQLCRIFDDKLKLVIADKWLDLVAVGLVGDVMDLRSPETRFLVQQGLANPQSQFILQTLETLDFSMKGELTPFTVAFYIAPLINAVNRIGSQEEKELLFRAMLDADGASPIESGKRGAKGEMVPLVMEALRQATNAKARQARRQDKLAALIDDVVSEEGLLENKVLLVTIDDFDQDQRALAGLICNKLQELYQRPAILVFLGDDMNYAGSVRAPDRTEAFADFRQQCEDSGCVVYAQGHELAFGIKIASSKMADFQEFFNVKYDSIDVSQTYNVDFVVDAKDPALPDIIADISQYKTLWGQGLSEPLIAIKNVQIGPSNTILYTRKNPPTMKISLPNGVDCMRFKSSKEEFDSLIIPYDGNTEQCYTTTIVGRASMNEYQGSVTPQIFIVDYEVHGAEYIF